jgi:hypothetical protein
MEKMASSAEEIAIRKSMMVNQFVSPENGGLLIQKASVTSFLGGILGILKSTHPFRF